MGLDTFLFAYENSKVCRYKSHKAAFQFKLLNLYGSLKYNSNEYEEVKIV